MPRSLRIGAIAVAVLLHLAGGIGLYWLMRPRPGADRDRIEVRLLDPAPDEPALPEPPSPMRPHLPESGAAATQRVRAAAENPAAPSAAPIEPIPQVHLFNADGSVILPGNIADRTDPAQLPHVNAKSTAPSALMQLKRPVKIRPNHFAGAWKAPENENLLGEALRKAGEFVDKNLSVEKEFDTPLGKIKCKAAFMIVMAAGCADVPPKAYEPPKEKWKPATVFDEE